MENLRLHFSGRALSVNLFAFIAQQRRIASLQFAGPFPTQASRLHASPNVLKQAMKRNDSLVCLENLYRIFILSLPIL